MDGRVISKTAWKGNYRVGLWADNVLYKKVIWARCMSPATRLTH